MQDREFTALPQEFPEPGDEFLGTGQTYQQDPEKSRRHGRLKRMVMLVTAAVLTVVINGSLLAKSSDSSDSTITPFYLLGDAAEGERDTVHLVTQGPSRAGGILSLDCFQTEDLDLSLQFYLEKQEQGIQAEGICLSLIDTGMYPSSLGSAGGWLGYTGGMAVEIDVHQNPELGDPEEQHLALIAGDRIQPVEVVPLQEDLTGQWHTLRLRTRNGVLTVSLDGKKVLTRNDLALPDLVCLCISASTGEYNGEHLVRNVVIRDKQACYVERPVYDPGKGDEFESGKGDDYLPEDISTAYGQAQIPMYGALELECQVVPHTGGAVNTVAHPLSQIRFSGQIMLGGSSTASYYLTTGGAGTDGADAVVRCDDRQITVCMGGRKVGFAELPDFSTDSWHSLEVIFTQEGKMQISFDWQTVLTVDAGALNGDTLYYTGVELETVYHDCGIRNVSVTYLGNRMVYQYG